MACIQRRSWSSTRSSAPYSQRSGSASGQAHRRWRGQAVTPREAHGPADGSIPHAQAGQRGKRPSPVGRRHFRIAAKAEASYAFRSVTGSGYLHQSALRVLSSVGRVGAGDRLGDGTVVSAWRMP